MNVFVLCTGRTGSTTFAEACQHMDNYTAAHESRVEKLGTERFNYPANHIEIDNRLSWMLGRLDRTFGKNAFYVHLTRNQESVAKSFYNRWFRPKSIIRAYAKHILMSDQKSIQHCDDMIDTINTNIELFLKDKPNKMSFSLENAEEDFKIFWEQVGAQGNVESALKEWTKQHNASGAGNSWSWKGRVWSAKEKLKRLITQFPDYIRHT